MHDLSVAFVWHQHQPYYSDDVSGYNPMPWVRLHGTKDYWGLAMHLAEVPEVHATINLVPSLVSQILAYTERNGQDEHLRVSRLPADGLSEADGRYLLDTFFMVNPDHMIRPHPRYWELYQQRGLHVDQRRTGAAPVHAQRRSRSAMLEQPGLVPPDRLRKVQGSRRVPS